MLIKNLIISMRPRQWIKNVTVFSAPFLSGEITNTKVYLPLIEVFVILSILSSASYLFNDVLDRNSDIKHPYKRNRPIASGKISPLFALLITLILLITGMFLAFKFLPRTFFWISAGFVATQAFYSLLLKKLIIIDAMTVALGFVLRVYAGSFVVSTPISSWFILSTIGISLLLAFGKRRSERTLLEASGKELDTRITLKHYPTSLLDSSISLSAAYTALAYSVFAFQTSPQYKLPLDVLPVTLSSPKWMLLTILPVLYGIFRYLYVIYEKREGESPEKVLLEDKPLLITVLSWIILTYMVIYALRG